MSSLRSFATGICFAAAVLEWVNSAEGAELRRVPPQYRAVRRAAAEETVLAPKPTAPRSRPEAATAPAESATEPLPAIATEGTVIPNGFDEGMMFGEFAGPPIMGCDPCPVIPTRWASFEYLLWWRTGQSLPPLVTSSPDGTAQEEAGVLGFDTTQVLYGGSTDGGDVRPGGRIILGVALDPMACHAIEGRFFILGDSSISYSNASADSPILARPFLDDSNDSQASLLLAFPDFTTNGTVTVQGDSEVLGGSVLYRLLANRAGASSLQILGGYEFARINESLSISNGTESLTEPIPGTTFDVRDDFAANNEFHGGSIGLAFLHDAPRWNLELFGKVAFGNMNQVVNISGQSVITTPSPDSSTETLPFGLLAQGANLGQTSRNQFTVAPEFGINLNWHLTQLWNLKAGYSFLYWNHVAQAASQIDPELRVPTQQFAITDGGYSLHGINFGAELRF